MVVSCMDLSGNVLLAQTMQQAGLTGVTQYWFDGYDETALHQFASAMQGVYFLLQHVPFEVATARPRPLPGHGPVPGRAAALRARDACRREAALAGWTSADLFVTGLRAIGRDVTRTRLVAAINRMSDYTADGIDAADRLADRPRAVLSALQLHGVRPGSGRPLRARLRHSAERVQLLPGPRSRPGRSPRWSAARPGYHR